MSVYSFFGQSRVSNSPSCLRVLLLGWLIGDLIAAHFTFAMHVVASVTLQSKISKKSWDGEQTSGNKPKQARKVGYNTVGRKSNDDQIISNKISVLDSWAESHSVGTIWFVCAT